MIENLNNEAYSAQLDLWASLYLFMNEMQPGMVGTTAEPVLYTMEDVKQANLATINALLHMGVTVTALIEHIPEIQDFLQKETSLLA